MDCSNPFSEPIGWDQLREMTLDLFPDAVITDQILRDIGDQQCSDLLVHRASLMVDALRETGVTAEVLSSVHLSHIVKTVGRVTLSVLLKGTVDYAYRGFHFKKNALNVVRQW